MYQRFIVDQLEYGMGVSKSGNVWLDLLGGVTRKGSACRNPCKDLFWDEPCFEDVDLGVNTLRVFRAAGDNLLRYIFTKRPGRIGFSASTERKVNVYRWMAARLARRLKNYNLVEYPAGMFNYYRQASVSAEASEEIRHATC